MIDILEFINEHGVSIITLLLVLLSLFKDQLKAALQRRVDVSARKQETEAEAEAQAWARVFRSGDKANGYVDRLLIQAEHHAANLRERDKYIERIVTVAVEAIRSAVAVMETALKQQAESDEQTRQIQAELARVLRQMHEQFSGIGLVLSLYLHERQGITYDALMAAVSAKPGDVTNSEMEDKDD